MTNRPTNPISPEPNEEVLLAWVEGETLTPAQDAAVARLLAADAGLARTMQAMRADRRALRSMGDVKAPSDLMARAEATIVPMLERRLLLDLKTEAATPGDIPISIVQPERRPAAWRLLLSDRVGRRFALAATLLLVLGGSTYFITTNLDRPIATGPISPIARGPSESEGPKATRLAQADTKDATAMKVAPERLATPIVEVPATAIAAAEPATDGSVATIAASEPETVTVGSAPSSDNVERAANVRLTSAEAAVLARDHRLIIRVCTKDPAILVRPQRVADRVRRAASPAWRVSGEAPTALAAALSAPVPIEAPEIPVDSPLIMADSGPAPEVPVFGPPVPSVADLAQAPRPVYMVEARLDAASLESLRLALGGMPAKVVFEAADSPLAMDYSPVINPSTVLWWGQPTSAWATWGRVPVVVDLAK
ncbi:MAG: anti-sigma factor family protein [Phycisphaerales bacterium]